MMEKEQLLCVLVQDALRRANQSQNEEVKKIAVSCSKVTNTSIHCV